MLQKENFLLILYFVVIIFILVAFVVIFVIAFQRRKNKLIIERLEAEKKFETELTNSRLEIQEQTLKNIAWELHDNVGQLLSVANIQLNMVQNHVPEELKSQIKETKDVVAATVQEVRALSRTLNTDVIQNNGLIESVRTELERFNRLNFLHADLKIEGEPVTIPSADEIIIFRILQEFFSNVIKHAKADKLFVHLCYREQELEINVDDDGVGFDTSVNAGNSGLHNMRGRADLLGAEYELTSDPGKGTKLNLLYPLKS
ncbi:sensor histidine kinase [Aureitalea sp. L0-47]|uniref:sensor histidine kinase n=1 Tax=Aureitalea sp. L0-47 TaxID=2816962 RepID=UPI002237EFC9|nr:sensor histidine kinase [Aureitalea sp. L0-47]MCW5520576.1 sensor histidine kinase [Aureitalea sp. L0-47]